MTPTDIITYKKELLQEQIENFERSGHFTEKEMNRLCAPIKMELELLECCETHNNMTIEISQNTSSFEDFVKAYKKMSNAAINITVIDAEILTPNNTQA